MATQAYYTWVSRGRPYRIATPIGQLRAWAVANNIKVLGTIGNEEHLTAKTPKDHTPFSFTPWPVPLPGYVVTAIDLANTNGLGGKILAQARAGKLPWLKYMNFDQKNYNQRDGFQSSSYNADEHVHISIRSDWCDKSIGTFDPFGTGGVDEVEFIKVVQDCLRAAGYDPGESDGEAGPKTQAALIAAFKASGAPGPQGPAGPPGKTPKTVVLSLTGQVTEVIE